MEKLARLTAALIEFNAGEPGLTHHLLKVHGFAATIGRLEGLPAAAQLILEAAAIAHDIGIKHCQQRYGKCTAKMQEDEGPGVARPILESLGFDPANIDRVCYLIGHHHTLTDIDGMDYQILLEADYLVNIHEGNLTAAAGKAAYETVFKTETGRKFWREMYEQAI